MRNREKKLRAFIAVIVFASFLMRSPIGTVGPLMSRLMAELEMSALEGGMLTTLPLLLFALSAPLSGPLSRRMGIGKTIAFSFFLVFIGTVVRATGTIVTLFLGTALLGLGTGALNVLVPSSIKEYYPGKSGMLTGLYSSLLTLASATTAAFILPLTAALLSWRRAFLLVSFFPLPAILIFLFFVLDKDEKGKNGETGERKSVFSTRNLLIAFYTGSQSLLFFTILTWYPTIISSNGLFQSNSGILLTIMQASSFLPSLLIPIVTERRNITALSALIPAVFIPGILLSYFGGSSIAVTAGTIVFGLSSGASFSMALMLSSFYGRNGEGTARIMAFGQTVGYLLASFGPMGFGRMYDITLSWTGTIGALMIISLAMSVIALLIKRSDSSR